MSIFSFGSKAADRVRASSVSTARDTWMRTAFEAAPIGLATATVDGRWLNVNDTCCQLLGYTRNELAHYSLNDLTHAEDANKELVLIRRVLAGDQRQYRIEKRIIDKGGAYRTHLVSATLVRGSNGDPDVFVYVIEPPQTPAESGQDAGRLAISILEQLNDVAVIRTDSRGMVTGWNKGAERILGFKHGDILGKNRRTLYRDEDNWDDKPATHLRLAAEQRHFACDDFRVARSGQHLWLHSTLLSYAPDGIVRGYVEVLSPRNEDGGSVDMKPMIEQLRRERDEAQAARVSLLNANEELQRQSDARNEELRVLAGALRDEIERRGAAEREIERIRDLRALDDLREVPAPPPIVEVLPAPAADEIVPVEDEQTWKTLEDARPLDLLLDCAANRRTGALIVADGTWNKAIFFQDGRLTCIASDDPGDFLGERLVRGGLITEAQRAKALQLALTTDLAFGRCLVILDAISDEVVREALRGKIEDDIDMLAGWTGCSWSFVDREPPHRKLLQLSIDVHDLRAVRAAIGSREVRGLCAVSNYVTTRSGSRFHVRSCKSLRRTSDAQLVSVASKREAKSRGLKPCGVCLK